jgi:hypothetical protein
MRVLFTIPHYFSDSAAAAYGSERGAADLRTSIIRRCIASLHQTFSESQGLLDGRQKWIHPANQDLSASIAIALCTTGDNHLVPHLADCDFTHISTNAEPRLLGFECQNVLRDNLGDYDYYVYLEDDLRIVDGMFFAKLAWFNGQFGDGAILQPNRFELASEPPACKIYIDGNLRDSTISPALQRIEEVPRLEAEAFGGRIAFERVDNPHSGCFFLNAAQFAHWAAQPDFAVPSARFWGPLESAATLGIMQNFRAYKPARENAAFLEVEHLDRRYIGRIVHPVPGQPVTGPWT